MARAGLGMIPAIMRAFRIALAALLLLAVAAPATAYIIVLEDGSRLVADREYEVRGSKAIITLPNGTTTSIDAKEIDREATIKANKEGYGTAVVIEGNDTREVRPKETAEKPPQPTLSELASRGSSRLEPHRRQPRTESGPVRRTAAGFADLAALDRRRYGNLEIAAEIQRVFRGQGVDQIELYQGTKPDRPFAEITAGSEASVFRALTVAAAALLAVHESHPGMAALELLLTTPARERAGQFVLTPDSARQLVAGEVEVAEFFVEHVQF